MISSCKLYLKVGGAAETDSSDSTNNQSTAEGEKKRTWNIVSIY